MFDIGLSEIIVIMIIALLVIGPKKLPDVARAMGKGLAEFKRALDGVKEELNVDQYKSDVNDFKDSLLFGKAEEEKSENSGERSPKESESLSPTTPDEKPNSGKEPESGHVPADKSGPAPHQDDRLK